MARDLGDSQERASGFLARLDKRLATTGDRIGQFALRGSRRAMEEAELERHLESNLGIRMSRDLTDEQREWVLKHAALAAADYDDNIT